MLIKIFFHNKLSTKLNYKHTFYLRTYSFIVKAERFFFCISDKIFLNKIDNNNINNINIIIIALIQQCFYF
jgi:hypothetical protein